MERPAQLKQPVFVVGMPRSGTTLLYRTLLRHSTFKPRRPAAVRYLVETKAFQYSEGLGPHLFHFMQDDRKLYEACARESGAALKARRFMNALGIPHALTGRPPSLRRAWWRLTGGRRLAATAFRYAAAARQTPRLIEKTPNHGLYLPEIAATFNDSSAVWIQRHPVDVFASYRRRGETEVSRGLKTREENRWLKVTPAIFCGRHREFTRALREAAAGDLLPLRQVSYEDFTARPAEVFAAICRFLDIAFEEGPLQGGAGDINDPRDPLLSSPIRAETRDWTAFVNGDECRFIEDELAEDMEFLGYERRRPL